ncbi:MAG: hypothetical protein A2504_17060 [Bdellovibrionales bacterium RIFOXYD12_FULL_39_22]|nr:MAG: hypothetical protein A2385_10900 [Bdellovibrionales bacterium RIFOXYB1_FULL_39_21]OFZ40718.1 MAG: hypothetical protein A2485_16830 [Bdellovibrionales bacterium RIFOXYC12_FULL_39_17]OFZ48140.1 MAG: hypothetical protein A2404_16990 [Bdellovibrionales bacterium RIFOXYC1_FULL_39_130]OFZ71972.1 MAG: hypothetical protein A2451_14165 [Bdellovibrionales bacterium RIFOXYC2_FULL_39_8]OFZ75790.1 MAG: hypothetical protein A2560_13490 [Bdellovibrionales bacterium RIFOXYD1_FULL_39_84]OFZ91851.1 MAG:
MYKYVYHGSHVQNMKVLIPIEGSHKKPWVYAAKEIEYCATFIHRKGTGGDFSSVSYRDDDTGLMCICERYSGALDRMYDGVSGSIYILPGETFREDDMTFDAEVISEVAVRPVEEIKISNMKEFLLQQCKENKFKIYFHPNRPSWVPTDDEDIVFKAVIYAKAHGERQLEYIKELQSHLYNRVTEIYRNPDLIASLVPTWLERFPNYKNFILDSIQKEFPEVYPKLKL